ncbi:MAG: hypothetical protein Kow0062_24220 [Acidobacteriota bacterium]|nr:MAG: hypothetical protein D6738_02250 [Acidobacteriota bacterium]
MRNLVYAVALLALVVSVGCAVTDYPFVVDSRGDFDGLVRTAHKAYIVPSAQVATIYADGSDELFSMVLQNQYGDQTLYTFNNFDPTGSVLFLDQTYCDWKYDGCEIVRAWNPRQNDEPFDYEFFGDCSGARSLSLLVDYESRIGECGDNIFAGDPQAKARLFANLDTTTWRGGTAYLMPLRPNNFWVTLTDPAGDTTWMPIYGEYNLLLTERLQLVVPVTPNARHQIAWLNGWIAEHGNKARVWMAHKGVQGWIDVTFRPEGLTYNAGRL